MRRDETMHVYTVTWRLVILCNEKEGEGEMIDIEGRYNTYTRYFDLRRTATNKIRWHEYSRD